ncbi:MAG: hypothetical protein LUE98_20175 [Tannerellaceae bacterium]|nr:hypothetical protein [Tannerellaceae bacterium]
MIPCEWAPDENLLYEAATHKLAGGNMINVIRSCALKLHASNTQIITKEILLTAIRREQSKGL